jgi:hypothetical protein
MGNYVSRTGATVSINPTSQIAFLGPLIRRNIVAQLIAAQGAAKFVCPVATNVTIVAENAQNCPAYILQGNTGGQVCNIDIRQITSIVGGAVQQLFSNNNSGVSLSIWSAAAANTGFKNIDQLSQYVQQLLTSMPAQLEYSVCLQETSLQQPGNILRVRNIDCSDLPAGTVQTSNTLQFLSLASCLYYEAILSILNNDPVGTKLLYLNFPGLSVPAAGMRRSLLPLLRTAHPLPTTAATTAGQRHPRTTKYCTQKPVAVCRRHSALKFVLILALIVLLVALLWRWLHKQRTDDNRDYTDWWEEE